MIAFCFFIIFISEIVYSAESNGWHENIDWLSLEEAQEQSIIQSKPIMMIVHRSWCGACKRLKPLVAESEEVAKLSKNFLMVNTMEEPDEEFYKPDGGYIPRIFFIKDGEVVKDIYNTA